MTKTHNTAPLPDARLPAALLAALCFGCSSSTKEPGAVSTTPPDASAVATPDTSNGGAAPVEHHPAPTARAAVPSKGCELGIDSVGKTDTGSVTIQVPVAYDGINPLPMIWAFHDQSDSNNDELVYYGQSQMARDYVMIYPAWSGRDYAARKARVDAEWQEVVDTYCVDLAHVFATGWREGARLLTHLLCDNDTRFSAVAPIDGTIDCNSMAPIPVLFMGGELNTGHPAGTYQTAADIFALSNGCSTSTPYRAIMGCTLGSYDVKPGCVEYQDCSQPTRFCYFSEPQVPAGYDGRPCFGKTAMYDFFNSIR